MTFSAPQIAALKDFINLLKHKPELLHDPQLGFFRDYLLNLGATIPEPETHHDHGDHDHSHSHAHGHEHDHSHSHAHGHDHDHSHSHSHSHSEPEPEVEEEEEVEVEEPEVEEEPEPVDPDVIAPETDAPQPMGDESKEPSDEDREKASALRGEASEHSANGDFAKAVELLTEAITKHNGSSAPLYASRAQLYLKLKKPVSAIRDAEAAIRINPDSATAYRVRGRARVLLGQWEDAVADLKSANMRDYDPDINDLLKSVVPKAQASAERRKAREEREKRKKRKAESHSGAGAGAGAGGFNFGGGFPFPGAGGAGGFGGIPPELLQQLMSDPELLAAAADPAVLPILTELSQNPAAIHKYKDHPKVGKLIDKFAHLFKQ